MIYKILAEGAGFEPAIRFPVYTLSKRAPSATRPPLRRKRQRNREHLELQPLYSGQDFFFGLLRLISLIAQKALAIAGRLANIGP